MSSQVDLRSYLQSVDRYLEGDITAKPPVPPIDKPIQGLSFTANPEVDTVELSTNAGTPAQQVNAGELKDCLLEKDKNNSTTDAGNLYKKTEKGKIAGGIIGALAPIGVRLVQAYKAGSAKGLFKILPLALAVPAAAMAGLTIGAIADNFTNAKRAQAADDYAAKA